MVGVEEDGVMTAGVLHFHFPQEFPPLKESGSVFENGLEKADRVGQIRSLDGTKGFEPKRFEGG